MTSDTPNNNSNNSNNSNSAPSVFVPLDANHVPPQVPAMGAVASALLIPLVSVTILPLTLVSTLTNVVVKQLLLPKPKPLSPEALDSGYVVSPSQLVPRAQRKYDIVLLGATGYTGKLALRHMVHEYASQDGPVKWAIAGRNKTKLEQVKQQVSQDCGGVDLSHIDVLVVDTSIPSSLPKLVEQTRVVATTVGPYSLYGGPVVEFCAKFGTHYVDITGEVDWVKTMMIQWQSTAQQTGARLIPFCGHDSIPWDLSVMKLQDTLRAECEDDLVSVTFFDTMQGVAPPGTLATVAAGLDGKVPKPPRQAFDPFLRLPNGEKSKFVAKAKLPPTVTPAKADLWPTTTLPNNNDPASAWKMFFVMAPVNAAVVRWSHALRQQGSPDLSYTEWMLQSNFASAFSSSVGLVILGILLGNPVTSTLLRKFVFPKSGASIRAMDHDHFLYVQGQGVGRKGNRAESLFYLKRDAGIVETTVMMMEAGLCLALTEDAVPAKTGGFWPPAAGLGNVLVQRLLDRSRLVFSYRALPPPPSQPQARL